MKNQFNKIHPLTKFGLLAILLILFGHGTFAQSNNPLPGGWQANGGSVNSLFNDSVTNTLYAGGDFTAISRPFSYGTGFNLSTGNVDLGFANPDGPVWAVVADGAGGWYIGGSFTNVGGLSRNGLAQINALGQVTAWNPNANNQVRAMTLIGTTLYVGGLFTNVGGQIRHGIAAISTTTGIPTTWNPDAGTGSVYTLQANSSVIFAGGSFTTIGGQSRNNIAALDINTGLASSWNPNANGTVWTNFISGGILYAGGDFTTIGGQPRSYVAALNATSGSATAWNPGTNATVRSILRSGTTVYIGGNFFTAGGQPRTKLAAVSASTGLATSWYPNLNGNVLTLSMSGSDLFVGGEFTTVGAQPRSRLAAINTITGSATSWDPRPSDFVYSLAISGNTIYAGGGFNGVATQTRNRLASFNANTGALTAWNPNVGNGSVNGITVKGDTVYIGGSFNSIGGEIRTRLAGIDAATGLVTNWSPCASGTVNTLVSNSVDNIIYAGGQFADIATLSPYGVKVDGTSGIADFSYANPDGEVYCAIPDGNGGWFIGGNFTKVGSQSRNKLAQIDANGQVTSWNPNIGGNNVKALLLDGNLLYVGGSFGSVGGQTYNSLAAIDITTGLPSSWNPDPNSDIYALASNGGVLFVAGGFNVIGGQNRNVLAAIDKSTGLATSWNPSASGSIRTLSVDNGTLYVGGNFSNIGGQSRNHIAALDIVTGLATPWDPNPNNSIYAIKSFNGNIYVGGDFSSIGGQSRKGIASFNSGTGSINAWNANSNGGVYAIAANGSTLYLAGPFFSIGGQSNNRLAAVDINTAIATSWNPGCPSNADVNTIAVSTGNGIYLGGTFTGINAQNRLNLAALDGTTGAITAWNPHPNSGVNALLLDGNTLYVGGNFSSIGGQSRGKVAAIDATTGLAGFWNPNANGRVLALVKDGNTIYAGGLFTSIGGQPRNYLAALSAVNGLATSWNPNLNASVLAVQKMGNTVYAGGFFTTVGSATRNSLAGIDASTGLATSWDPNLNASVNALSATPNYLFVGGNFSQVGGTLFSRFAAFSFCSPQLTQNPQNICQGNSYTFNGHTYSTAGNHYDTLQTTLGCDSIIVTVLTVSTGAPGKPGPVTQAGGNSRVCPGETRTYTTTGANGAVSYNWTVPTGASVTSGQGTASITVLFGGAYPVSDTVKVIAVNACGNSDARIKVVNRASAPNTPSAITGENYGLCTASGVAYSVTNVAGLTYAWSFSNANGTVTTGQGSNAITADYTPGAPTSVLTVTAANGCGTSAARTKTIYAKPITPASITGPAAVCAHANGVAYSTPPVSGATSYTWKAPAGSHVSDGVTTSTGASLTTSSSSVTVNFGASAGNVQVKANNACASSGFFLYPITMNCRMINGAEQPMVVDEVSVYPNPASNLVTVKFNTEAAGEYTVHVYDVIGKEVLTTSGSTSMGINQVDLNTSLLASGVYHLVLKSSGVDYNTKLVLDK